ncbi:cytochrome P450 [Kitasatospora sp. LaBMicrA B282]|uniref:cytochrome P450 n=1 Tax=Kitasatospora sp. LaBMicrA B282 TaxID=3420949 RepID=UPI003D13A5D5
MPDQRYDLHSKAYFADPYPVYHAMREHDPVYRQPETGAWMLTRHDDMVELCRHPRVSADRTAPLFPAGSDSGTGSDLGTGSDGDIGAATAADRQNATLRNFLAPWLIFLDGAEHARVRSVLSRSFTPRAIAGLRPFVRTVVDDAITTLRAADSPDLIRDLALPVPARVIGHLLGLPPEDLPGFQQSVNAVFQFAGQLGDPEENLRLAHRATEELGDYFRALVAEKRRARRGRAADEPPADLVSIMITADEDGGLLTEHELVANCALLLVTGHETTTHTLGNGVIALLRHPEQLRLLRDKPELIGSAVEEILRYDSSSGLIGRLLLDDIEIRGQRIEQGSFVYAVGQAANRDPAVYPDPDRFDITRTGPRHLGFGHGVHACIGAALARLETDVALTALLRAFPDLAPVTDEYDWIASYSQRGVRSLPVAL